MVKSGMGQGKTVEAEATKVLKRPEFTVTIDLNSGSGSGSILTCDFSVDYVRINADYRS
jgi:glutamate N-acetyltransferase/amino-acid N-acetyltransferase